MNADVLLAELCAPFADADKVHLNNAGVSPMTARAERALVDTAACMRDGTLGVATGNGASGTGSGHGGRNDATGGEQTTHDG